MNPIRSHAAVIATLAAMSALSTLATNIVLPVLPEITSELGAPPDSASSVLWAFLAVFGVGQLVAGPLADRWGRRVVLWLGLLLFVVGSVVAWRAGDLSVLLTGRALQGLGAAATSMLARAIARDLFEGPPLARTLGWVMAIMAAAPGFSPLLGALIGSAWGWRATLLALIAIAAVIVLAHQLLVGETLPRERRQAPPPGSIVAAYVELARDERFRLPALANALTMAGLFALFAISPVVLRSAFGLGTFGIGVFFAATVFAVFAAASRVPKWTPRYGADGVIRLGLWLCVAAAGGVAASLAVASSGLLVYVAASALFLFGMGLVNPTSAAAALSPFPARAGQASALLGFMQMSSATAGLLVLPLIAAPAAIALAAVLAGVAALALGVLRRRLTVAAT